MNCSTTRTLAAYAIETDLSDTPDEAIEQAVRTLIDTVGVTIGGRNEAAVAKVRKLVGTHQHGSSTVLSDGTKVSPLDAALVNGVAAHALDYDDVVDFIYGHPSAVLWPALLAVGEDVGSSTRQLLDAYLIAFDIEIGLASGLTVRDHYSQGWHSTATLGVVAAAAGVSRLIGSTAEQTAHALGIAATAAGGSRQNFGSMTKPLHAGLAARDAVMSATLAHDGFTADPEQLEGPLGYFALFGDQSRLHDIDQAMKVPPGQSILQHRINVKKYPACYNTQRTVDAGLLMAERIHSAASEVTAVRLTVEPGGLDPLIHHRPSTGLEGKFSAEYAVVASLLDKRINLDTYTTDMVERSEVQRMLKLVTVAEDSVPPSGEAEWDQAYAVVDVQLSDGSTVVERVDIPRGDCRNPLSRDELFRKYEDCLGFGQIEQNQELLDLLSNFSNDERFTGFPELQPVLEPTM